MEPLIQQKVEKISQSITLKAIIIGFMTLLMLIPGAMIENLIQERQTRSTETIEKLNEKWSRSQTLNGPYLTIPYETTVKDEKNKLQQEQHVLVLTPEQLQIHSKLIPEERHYGIYKAILYKSESEIRGHFQPGVFRLPANSRMLWEKAKVQIGISDLRGMTNNLDFVLNGRHYSAEAGGENDGIGQGLEIALYGAMDTVGTKGKLDFQCQLKLKGSSEMKFIPAGRTTQVKLAGNWPSPGFVGSFTPEYKMDKQGFEAQWNVLHFNRNIPEYWIDSSIETIKDTSFGVNLVETVDHYQQNMRSAKYAFMFIALTFVLFFFVEILTKRKIHPIQYLLVGVALILFYSLLLSISEQLSFGLSYLIASGATVALIVIYAHSIFKTMAQTGILLGILTSLYVFLYVVLQLEDVALLIGSIGLFVILAVIMYVSRKITWYKNQ